MRRSGSSSPTDAGGRPRNSGGEEDARGSAVGMKAQRGRPGSPAARLRRGTLPIALSRIAKLSLIVRLRRNPYPHRLQPLPCAPVAQADRATVNKAVAHVFSRSAASDIVPTHPAVPQGLDAISSCVQEGVLGSQESLDQENYFVVSFLVSPSFGYREVVPEHLGEPKAFFYGSNDHVQPPLVVSGLTEN